MRIVDEMLRCATGGASNLGNDYFDQKFQKAYTDQEFRKALWGVEDLLPIKQIAALTCGLYKDSLSRVEKLSV